MKYVDWLPHDSYTFYVLIVYLCVQFDFVRCIMWMINYGIFVYVIHVSSRVVYSMTNETPVEWKSAPIVNCIIYCAYSKCRYTHTHTLMYKTRIVYLCYVIGIVCNVIITNAIQFYNYRILSYSHSNQSPTCTCKMEIVCETIVYWSKNWWDAATPYFYSRKQKIIEVTSKNNNSNTNNPIKWQVAM